QYTFLVSEKRQTSLAIGYLHEFELTEFSNYGKERFYTGNIYNPFFIVAKRWGQNYHTLVYTGPEIAQDYSSKAFFTTWHINSNIHYMSDRTRNFIGIEFNKEITQNCKFDMTIRPQMRIGIMDYLFIGIVSGNPIDRNNDRISSFIRLIY